MFPDENFITAKSPLEKNDHPELDNSELCNDKQITEYMCMIGSITMGYHPWQIWYPSTCHVNVQIQISMGNWVFRKNEEIIWISCEDQPFHYQV